MALGSGSQLANIETSCIVMRHKNAAAARCNRFETKIAMTPAMISCSALWFPIRKQAASRFGGIGLAGVGA